MFMHRRSLRFVIAIGNALVAVAVLSVSALASAPAYAASNLKRVIVESHSGYGHGPDGYMFLDLVAPEKILVSVQGKFSDQPEPIGEVSPSQLSGGAEWFRNFHSGKVKGVKPASSVLFGLAAVGLLSLVNPPAATVVAASVGSAVFGYCFGAVFTKTEIGDQLTCAKTYSEIANRFSKGSVDGTMLIIKVTTTEGINGLEKAVAQMISRGKN